MIRPLKLIGKVLAGFWLGMMIAAIVVALNLAVMKPAVGAEKGFGPYAAKVLRVIDGDTIVVTAVIWPGITVETKVRVKGVDTPELRGRCAKESRLAGAAKRLVTHLAGNMVFITDVGLGKYAGRVTARVILPDGTDLADVLIARRLGRPYDGKSKRQGWC